MMITAQNLRKSYGDLAVLRGVDLEVNKAEVVAIVGRSGAGKSTLLHILGTLDSPTEGALQIDGVDVTKLKTNELANFRNERIGFVFQFHHLLPEFSALENVCIPGFIRKTPEKQVRQRAQYLLEFLGLGDRLQHKPTQLSGGEQQRVSVARALLNNPAIVLADEPSGNLDTNTSQELHQLFFRLRDEFQQTFVIVTHNPELAASCDRILTMQDGLILR